MAGTDQLGSNVDGSDEPTFEEALVRLEAIVDQLEEGDLELESALAQFEEGVALTRRCAGQLEQAERRIEILSEQGDVEPAPASLTDPVGDADERSR